MANEYESAQILVETFRQECDAKLLFLESEYFAKKEFGLSCGDAPIASLVQFDPQRIPKFFLAVCRYRLRKIVIEIVFGDKDDILESRVFFRKSKQLFGLHEIALAAGLSDPRLDGGILIRDGNSMRQIIIALSAALKEHFALISDPGQPTTDRALKIRDERRREETLGHRKRLFEQTRNIAANEFRKRNFKNVIELLSPFEDLCSQADRKKLKIARRLGAECRSGD